LNILELGQDSRMSCKATYCLTMLYSVRKSDQSSLNHLLSNNCLAVGLSLQSNFMMSPINSLSFLPTSFSVVLWNGVVLDCGISCMKYKIPARVSGLAISSYFAGSGPKYLNCCFRTSKPYSSWSGETVRGRKRLKFPP
jgi:hypothetical protein